MKIALINICLRPYMDHPNYPIGLGYIASAIERAGFEFDLIDIDAHRYSYEEIEEILGKKTYDVVAFGVIVTGYKYIKRIASIARKTNPNAKIIAGNSVASSIPKILLTHTEVDIAVKGEGDITIIDLLNAIKNTTTINDVKGIIFQDNGRFIDTGYSDIITDISTIPIPNWDLFDMNKYLLHQIKNVTKPYPIPEDQIKSFTVNTARGCPFKCTFCYHVFQYTKYRYRSPNSILEEVKKLHEKYNINYITFFDELSFPNIRVINEFVDKILRAKMKFYWAAIVRSDLFSENDIDLLYKMKEAGCVQLGYSLESADLAIIKAMNKKNTPMDFRNQKRLIDRAGIKSGTSLVFGYPQETKETIKKTFDLCSELNLYPSVGYLLPQPGTPMFDYAVKQGFITDVESYLLSMGDRQDLHINFTKMTDNEFQDTIKDNLSELSKKLNLNFSSKNLIKKGAPRGSTTHDD
jgi:anaerobic magnesium-protoporphyrin IX monomethyl ester cyclase